MSVYFIRDTSSGLVKIGSATDPQKRLKELQTGSSGALEIVSIISGGRLEESRLHRRFAGRRRRGEWFDIEQSEIPTTQHVGAPKKEPPKPPEVPPDTWSHHIDMVAQRAVDAAVADLFGGLWLDSSGPLELRKEVARLQIEGLVADCVKEVVRDGYGGWWRLWRDYASKVRDRALDLRCDGLGDEADALVAFASDIEAAAQRYDENAVRDLAGRRRFWGVCAEDGRRWTVETVSLSVAADRRSDIQTSESLRGGA